jgi:hypothetical protein
MPRFPDAFYSVLSFGPPLRFDLDTVFTVLTRMFARIDCYPLRRVRRLNPSYPRFAGTLLSPIIIQGMGDDHGRSLESGPKFARIDPDPVIPRSDRLEM